MSEEYNPESSERIKELKEKLNDMANTAFVQEGQIKELEKKLEQERSHIKTCHVAMANHHKEMELKDSWVRHHQGSVEATMRKLAASEKRESELKDRLIDQLEALKVIREIKNLEMYDFEPMEKCQTKIRNLISLFLKKHEAKSEL